MCVEHIASVIVLTAGFSTDILIGDFLIRQRKCTDGRGSF